MLGIRLDRDLEARLQRFAANSRRSRSDIAREAVRQYLERHDVAAEFQRQVEILQASITADEVKAHEAATGAYLRMLDEEDGGYDWGPAGPPQ